MNHPSETCQVLGVLLESFRKIAIAVAPRPLLPDAMASDSPPVDAIRIRSSERGWRDRLTVAGRVALAAFGGYAVAGLVSALGAMTLPLSRAEAVSASILASFAVMAGIVIFVFAAASLRRAALTIAAAVILLTAALWLSGGFSATVAA